ncbi:MAG: hypothetical protein ACRDL3_09985 [Solirubrobacterales bacterium]
MRVDVRTRITRASLRVAAAAAAAVALSLAGCGDDVDDRPPGGPLAEALGAVGGGGAHGSLGVGWAEPRLVEKTDAGPELIAAALGPNAGTVIEAAPVLDRRIGFDPLSAERLLSVGGSYAFGLRLDGVDGARLRRALIHAGGRARRAGGLELVDIGEYAVVPDPLLRADVNGLGARDAFGRDATVLAISDTSRASLIGRGDRLLDEPIYRAAADCLGEVVAARMIPDRLLLSTDLGVDLVALGVHASGEEILCVLGGTAERADEIATALDASLAPDAREPRGGGPIGKSVTGVDVAATGPYDGVEVVRAALTPARGESPGFLFGTVARGSLVEMITGG